MIESPIKKYSANSSSDRFYCNLRSNDENDIKVIKNLAQQSNCTKLIFYKDYFEHCIKFHLMFRRTEDKATFMQLLMQNIEVCEKLKRMRK